MQRKGVPAIDGCLCEIKEKLKALYDRTHACILRINGKTPDGNGDITLDLSDAIPGRYVESVNGQDGNVIIDKASVGLSNVDNVSSSQILNQADANNQSRLEAFEAAKLDPVELEVVANSGRIIQLEGQQVVLDDKMEQTIQYVDAIGDDVATIPATYATKSALQGVSTDLGTTQTQLSNLANELHINKPYVTTNTDQTINSTKIFTKVTYGVAPRDGDNADAFVTKANVMSTDGKLNNLVHTIGNETKDGAFSIYGSSESTLNYSATAHNLFLKNRWGNVNTSPYNATTPMIMFLDNVNNVEGAIYMVINSNHTTSLRISVRNSDGTMKTSTLLTGDNIQ